MWFFNWLFDTDEYVARFHCLACKADLVNWYIANNLLIALAYFLIPLSLLYFRKHLRFRSLSRYSHIVWMFVLFIFSCGIGHVINVIMIWYPIYNFAVLWDGITAFVSLGTFVVMLSAIKDVFKNKIDIRIAKKN